MENRINQIITLASGSKYLVLRQAIYEDENYYVCVMVTDDEKEVTEEFELLHETKENGEIFIEAVTDVDFATMIFEYVGLIKED